MNRTLCFVSELMVDDSFKVGGTMYRITEIEKEIPVGPKTMIDIRAYSFKTDRTITLIFDRDTPIVRYNQK